LVIDFKSVALYYIAGPWTYWSHFIW